MIRPLLLILAPLATAACAGASRDSLPESDLSAMSAFVLPDASPPTPDRPAAQPVRVGIASWYGPRHQGRPTASGARYDVRALTAAHPSLPMGTRLQVTRLDDRRSVVVTVNDRGPNRAGRAIDLSWQAARDLGLLNSGLARVEMVEVAGNDADPGLSVAPVSRRMTPRFTPPVAVTVAETPVRLPADGEERP